MEPNRFSELRNSIIIVFIKDLLRPEKFKDLICHIKNKETHTDHCYIIFCGALDQVKTLAKAYTIPSINMKYVETIDFKIHCQPILQHFPRYAETDFEKYFSDRGIKPKDSVIKSLMKLYLSFSDAKEVGDRIEVKLTRTTERGDAYGMILLLALRELTPPSSTNDATDTMLQEYAAIGKCIPKKLLQQNPDTLITELKQYRVDIQYGSVNSGFISAYSVLEAMKDNELSKWPQWLALSHLQATNRTYNANSELFRNTLRLYPHIELCELISKENITLAERAIFSISMARTLASDPEGYDEEIRLFVNNISELCIPTLSMQTGMLIFQIIFHLTFSNPKNYSEEFINMCFEKFFNQPIPLLGILETLVKRITLDKTRNTLFPFESKFLHLLTNKYIHEAKNYTDAPLTHYPAAMAFDVLFKYSSLPDSNSSPLPKEYIDKFKILPIYDCWNSICRFIHLGGSFQENPENKVFFDQWHNMRVCFQKISEVTPTLITQRDPIPEALRKRVSELGKTKNG